MISIRGVLPALAAAILAAQALASEDIELKLANYDLKSVQGIARLHSDIVLAAISICNGVRPVTGTTAKSCVRLKVDETIAASGVPLLIQFHQALPARSRYLANPPEAATITLVSAN